MGWSDSNRVEISGLMRLLAEKTNWEPGKTVFTEEMDEEMLEDMRRLDGQDELNETHISPNEIVLRKKLWKFEYTNWRGETSVRSILPHKFWLGSTEYHQEKQWLLRAFDCDKNSERDFAVNDIIQFIEQ